MTDEERLSQIMESEERYAYEIRRSMFSYYFLGALGGMAATICLIYGLRNPAGMFEIHNLAIMVIGYGMAIFTHPMYRSDADFYLTKLESPAR
jgi:hypothetical protein